MELRRCDWVNPRNPLYVRYHDEQWGVPVRDDRTLFEMLVLEGAQAGLSWETVLNKRAAYRKAFDRFDVKKVAAYDAAKVRMLLADPGIIRNRLKIRSAIRNAKVFLAITEEFGGFERYLRSFVRTGVPNRARYRTFADIPATTPLSDAISKDLKKRGMTFVGSTIVYAYLQAVGIVNDHTTRCFRYEKPGPMVVGPGASRVIGVHGRREK